MTPDQRKRLPEYVKLELQRLETNVTYYKNQAFAAAGPNASRTNTFIRNGDESQGLPPDTQIGFRVGRRVITAQVEQHGDVCELTIRSEGSQLVVRPYACNVVMVEPGD